MKIIKKITRDLDITHYFAKDRKLLQENFHILRDHISKKGYLRISWQKGSSKVITDINENITGETGLREGFVNEKCAPLMIYGQG